MQVITACGSGEISQVSPGRYIGAATLGAATLLPVLTALRPVIRFVSLVIEREFAVNGIVIREFEIVKDFVSQRFPVMSELAGQCVIDFRTLKGRLSAHRRSQSANSRQAVRTGRLAREGNTKVKRILIDC